MKYAESRAGYRNMWRAVRILPERRQAALQIAKRAIANKARYQRAAAVCPGMPWWWVAAVHSLESSASWTRHLHNGDPLTARTRQVPAGRPQVGTPPFTWEESARDALTMHDLQRVPTWEIERCLYEFERYNGFGYVRLKVNSPYVWSFTNHYSRGKYVADGRYDPAAVSSQCGAAAIVKAVEEIETLGAVPVVIDRALPAAPVVAAPSALEKLFRWIGL